MNRDIERANKICKIVASMTEEELRLSLEFNESIRKLKLIRETEGLKNEI